MRAVEKMKDIMNRQSRNFNNISKKQKNRLIVYSIIFGVISCLMFRFLMNSINTIYYNFIIVLISLISGFIISFSLTPKSSWSGFSFIISAILTLVSFYITLGFLFAHSLGQNF